MNDQFDKKLIKETQAFWGERLNKTVSEPEAAEILRNSIGFFETLFEWRKEAIKCQETE